MMKLALDSIPLHWRACLAGALCYLLLPLAPVPTWQYQLWFADPAETTAFVDAVQGFVTRHGEQSLPILAAQRQLDAHSQLQAEFESQYQSFATQRRDEGWAEATEFVVKYVAERQPSGLSLSKVECRNTLCRLQIAAPDGLTSALSAAITQLVAVLKANSLEFADLKVSQQQVMIELRSDKRMQLSFFEEWRARPAERSDWINTVNTWLNAQN